MTQRSSDPKIRHIYTTVGDDRADYVHLLEYGEFQYHLLLQYNNKEHDCLENTSLQKIYDAFARDDFSGANDATRECLMLIWPFLEHDYASRTQSSASLYDRIKLQVITRNGVLSAVPHNIHMEYPKTKPVENIFEIGRASCRERV